MGDSLSYGYDQIRAAEERRRATHDRLTCNGVCGTPHDPPDEREASILAVGRVLDDIRDERVKQDRKWGKQRHPFDTWITVLTEEVGEAAERSLKGDREGLRKELVQVAAVAVAAIEHLDSREPETEPWSLERRTAEAIQYEGYVPPSPVKQTVPQEGE